MKEMFINDIMPETLELADLSDIVFKDKNGVNADGANIVVMNTGVYNFSIMRFKNGVLTNSIDEEGRISPAIEGAGFVEYRTNGVLTNPEKDFPARICEGFNKREYWENGKCVRVSEKSYDKNDNAVWS
ncbi:MAG: hypothetical protein P1P64_09690 [Treponemataceae bacterium]